MKVALLALTLATPAFAQVSPENQSEFIARARSQWQVLSALVSAAKAGDRDKFRALTMPEAVFMGPNWKTATLDMADISQRAKACKAVIGTDPEVIDGRVTLPRDKMEVFWQCPPEETSLSGKSVVEFSDMKIAFIRTFPGSGAIAVAKEAH